MYLTSTEYNTYTGRSASEATVLLIRQAEKLLDSRIGNHLIYSNGYKINTSSNTWYIDNYDTVSTNQKEAIKMWVASMIQEMVINGISPTNEKSIRLGRFSVQKENTTTGKILPETMNYVDSILISSGIIKRAVRIK